MIVIPVVAHDPDGDSIQFSAVIPADAEFTDSGAGSAEFRWEPAAGLAGHFPLVFTATDDGTPAERTSANTVVSLAAVSNEGGGSSRCGIGFELALILPPLAWLHRSRRRSH